MFSTYLYFVFIITFTYGLFICLFTIGWAKARANNAVKQNYEGDFFPAVSVIIPFRNEERNLIALLISIRDLHYENVEFLFVNDHSDDNGVQVVNQFKNVDKRIRLLHLQDANGKKQAIQYGVTKAKYELIATTDADCVLPTKWLPGIVTQFQNTDVKLVAGPVNGRSGQMRSSVFGWLDFISLMGTGLGSIGIGMPMYCNAANMAFRKEAFFNYLASNLGYQTSSGDDVFLLHYIKNKYGRKSIRAMINNELEVITNLPNRLSEFIKQRLRWGSKSIYYKDILTLIVAIVVYTINMNLAVSAVYSLIFGYWVPFAICFLGKTFFDLIFFSVLLKHFGRMEQLPIVVIYQFLYFMYMTLLAPASLVLKKIQWK